MLYHNVILAFVVFVVFEHCFKLIAALERHHDIILAIAFRLNGSTTNRMSSCLRLHSLAMLRLFEVFPPQAQASIAPLPEAGSSQSFS